MKAFHWNTLSLTDSCKESWRWYFISKTDASWGLGICLSDLLWLLGLGSVDAHTELTRRPILSFDLTMVKQSSRIKINNTGLPAMVSLIMQAIHNTINILCFLFQSWFSCGGLILQLGSVTITWWQLRDLNSASTSCVNLLCRVVSISRPIFYLPCQFSLQSLWVFGVFLSLRCWFLETFSALLQ